MPRLSPVQSLSWIAAKRHESKTLDSHSHRSMEQLRARQEPREVLCAVT